MDERRAISIEIALLAVLASFLTGCMASPEARIAAVESRAQQAALELAKRGDADSLAAAGALSRGGTLSEDRRLHRSVALLAQAATAAPERPELAWLYAQACKGAPPCEAETVEHRLRVLDPSNGAGWMGALTRADAAGDTGALDTALLAISTSDRVDIYWTTLVVRLSRAVAQTGIMSPQEAQNLITGYLASAVIPAYGAISRACKGERLQKQENIETCQGVAKAFERGDTYITEMIGVAIAKRVWAEDSPEYKAAVEARRVYEYRRDTFAKSDLANSRRVAMKYLALCEQNHREQDVFAAQLVDAGENPNPPPE